MDYEKAFEIEQRKNHTMRSHLVGLKDRLLIERQIVDKIITAPKTAKEAEMINAIWKSRTETDAQCP